MEKLIFRACTRRRDVRIVAYTKECLRQSSHTELQYSNTPLNAMSRQSQLTLTTLYEPEAGAGHYSMWEA